MKSEQRRIVIQALLFVTTFITATFAGSEWTYGRSVFMPDYSWQDFQSGLTYSIPFLLFPYRSRVRPLLYGDVSQRSRYLTLLYTHAALSIFDWFDGGRDSYSAKNSFQKTQL